MFDGSPAVSISAGNQRASDWLVLSGSSLAAGFTTTSILTVVMDTATDGNMRVKSTGLSGANQIVLIAGEQTYNMKDGWAGGSPFTGRCHCVAKIETKGGTIETTPDVPVIVTPPTLSPTTAIAGGGIVITCGTGSWTFSPTLFVYQWMRNGVDIAGATGNTYTTIVADDGTTVSCKVRSGNGAGPSAGYENTSNSCAVGGGSGGSSWIMGDGTWGDTDVWDDAGVWVD
jgi:hypothetical protein